MQTSKMKCQAPCHVFNRKKGGKYSHISLPPSIVKIKKVGEDIQVSLGDSNQAQSCTECMALLQQIEPTNNSNMCLILCKGFCLHNPKGSSSQGV